MNCNQCEQTAGGIACTTIGVCGKDPDIQSLQETLLYGLKGMCAYKAHARRLGMVDDNVNAFIEEALFATMTNVNFDLESHVELLMECGRQNLRVMQLLDEGHQKCFGQPSPVEILEGTKAGPGILVTGHDLMDLSDILDQSAGKGVNVYTHGEMMPGHSFPGLRKHPHLAGHFGNAWQDQRRDFARFTGPVVATTNCVLIPPPAYADRLFTTRVTAVPGGKRINGKDFTPVIEAARKCPPLPEHTVRRSTIGFHHTAILGLADKIVGAVKDGKLKHVFLIGGCDGAELGRNYYSDYAGCTPKDSLILTLGCGKFRIRNNEYGTFELDGVGPIPRLLDMGQCNDSYGAIMVAAALAKAFDCGVNDLPLTIVLSWFEQKAVAVLLTLLSLGVKGIRVGPKPPAFISPKVMSLLQEQFDLQPIGHSPAEDVQEAMLVGA